MITLHAFWGLDRCLHVWGEDFHQVEEALAPVGRSRRRVKDGGPGDNPARRPEAPPHHPFAARADGVEAAIFARRGRPRERLLAELRAMRDAAAEPELGPAAASGPARGGMRRGVAGTGGSEHPTGPFWGPGPGFNDARFDPRSDGQPDALVREVAPLLPHIGVDLLALLAPAYRAVAEAAKAQALGRITVTAGDNEVRRRPRSVRGST